MAARQHPVQHPIVVLHRSGERRELVGFVDVATDRAFVDWGLAGEFEVVLRNGRIFGCKSWHVEPKSLRWFRQHSERWQKRRAKKRCFFAGAEQKNSEGNHGL